MKRSRSLWFTSLVGLCLFLLAGTPASTLIVQAATPPSTPTGLTAVPGDRQATLQWNANPEVDLSYYKIYISLNAVDYSWTDSVFAPGTSYLKTGLVNGATYYFTISAVNTSGQESAQTAPVSVKPSGTPPSGPPAMPTGLRATAGNAQITLNWNANSEPNLSYYKVYWSTKSGGPFTFHASVLKPSTTYVQTKLVNGVTYYFKLSAVNSAGQESAQTAAVSAKPSGSPPTAPAVPTGLRATPGNAQVSLAWNANTEPNLSYYKIYLSLYATTGFKWTVNVLKPGTTYTKTGLINGATYYFKISAVNTSGQESALSAAVSAKPTAPAGPSTPTGLAATPGNGTATLKWYPNPESNLKYYKIYISTSAGGTYSWSTSMNAPGTAAIVGGLRNGITYYFKISVVNTSNVESGLSTYVFAKPSAISTPTGFRASVGAGSVTLTWNANPEPDITAYRIYAGASPNGVFSWMDGTVASQRTYTKSGLNPGYIYYFRLVAVIGNEESGMSSHVTVMSGNDLRLSQDSYRLNVQYRVPIAPGSSVKKWANFIFNAIPVKGADGFYQQLAPSVFYDGVALTSVPYLNGLSGLVSDMFNGVYSPPPVAGAVEQVSPSVIKLKYTSTGNGLGVLAGNYFIRFTFQVGKPFVQIESQFTASTTVTGKFGLNLWPAIGGAYNPLNRNVVPWDDNTYYVVNGHAVGVHYFPRIRPWSLKMGQYGTSYARITSGFFAASPSEARQIVGYDADGKPWTMAHDYCPGPHGSYPQDSNPIPSIANIITTAAAPLFSNYQEDEGGLCTAPNGLGYGWQEASSIPRTVNAGQQYNWRIFLWVGEDAFDSSGQAMDDHLNYDSTYRFNIDYWYHNNNQTVAPLQAPQEPQPPFELPQRPNVNR